jgi:Tfp pilus assembly protein PilN
MTNNQISDRKAQQASLQDQVTQTQAEAQKLNTFVSFASLQQARQETVSSLAASRFDWQRVLRELAIVIPQDVWLTGLEASAAGSASSSGTSSSSTATDIQGPSLDIQGCAAGHESVARFLSALRDIDGVTRVAVLSSDRQGATGSATAPSGSGTGASCSSRNFIASFEVEAAFDAALPAAATATAPTTTSPTTTASAPSTGSTTTASTGDSQISDAQQQLQQQKDSAAQKSAQGRKDVGALIPGTGSAP